MRLNRRFLIFVLCLMSVGCGYKSLPPCAGPLEGGFFECGYEWEFDNRYYQFQIPQSYTGAALPLVLDLHGAFSPVVGKLSGERLVSGMQAVAEQEGFIVAWPQGINLHWSYDSSDGGVDDYGFLLALIEEIKSLVAVDTGRIYVTGISNGGGLAQLLGCGASDVFAGVATVSMQLPIAEDQCVPGNALPVISFHAPTDTLVSWEDGGYGYSASESFNIWSDINGCVDAPEVYFTQGKSTCSSVDQCSDSAKVAFCEIDGEGQLLGGHLLYYNNDEVSLAGLTWSFLSQFRRQ